MLGASERHDAQHYWISPDAFATLRRRYGPRPTPDAPRHSPNAARQATNLARSAAHAAKSVAKTAAGIDRLPDEQVAARINICRHCPGNHAVWKTPLTPPQGKRKWEHHTPATPEARDALRDEQGAQLHTCGPMLASARRAGKGTCGCVLGKKARDAKEHCPFGWWPTRLNAPEN